MNEMLNFIIINLQNNFNKRLIVILLLINYIILFSQI